MLVPRGLYAAMARLNQSNTDVPEADRAAVHAHLAHHYADMGEEAPDLLSREGVPEGADPRELAYWFSREPIVLQTDASPEGEAPAQPRSDIQVLKGGLYDHPWWDLIRFDRALMEQLVRNFDANVVGQQIHVDADHRQADRAQGWIERVWMKPGDPSAPAEDDLESELWARVRWTPLGVENITNEYYKYTSIQYWPDFKDNKGKRYGPCLTGTALTNIPFVTGMAELALSRSARTELPRAIAPGGTPAEPRLAAGHQGNTRGFTMAKLNSALAAVLAGLGFAGKKDATEDEHAQAFLARVREQLGDDEITDEGLALAVNAAFAEAVHAQAPAQPRASEDVVLNAVKEAQKATDARLLALQSSIEQRDATIADLSARVRTAEAEREDTRFDARFRGLQQERKVVPAQRETLKKLWDADKALFDATVAAFPARSELAGPVGSDATNLDGEYKGAPTETRYSAEVHRLMAEEKLGIKEATRRVRAEQPSLYNEHKRLTGRGRQELNRRAAAAAHELAETA